MQGNPNDPDEVAVSVSPASNLEIRVKTALADAQNDFASFTKNDQELTRKDTVEVCLDILRRIKDAAHDLNKKPEEVREKLYYLTFNATVFIFKICSSLRQAGYAKEATHFLAFNMLCLDNNLILTTIKYLDWRVLNYVELGRAYADMQAYKAALKVAEYGIQKVLHAKKVEEQDPPVPQGAKDCLVEALRVLRTQELKYTLQSGQVNADAWKKKLEEGFSVNKYHRSLAIVESLSLNDVNNCNLVQRNAQHLQIKTACLKIAIEMVRPEIEVVKQAMVQTHEKKRRDKEKKEKLASRENDEGLDELLENYKNLDNEMIKEADWKQASQNVPIEVHVELLKLCYEAKMWNEFDLLLDPALVRLKFRRYEIPYLATVDIQMSTQKISNIPNGFERLPKDLNAANLRIELKKLRASAKQGLHDDEGGAAAGDKPPSTAISKKDEPAAKGGKGDPKGGKGDAKAKGGKQAATAQEEEKKDEGEDDENIMASKKELDLIQHIYVNMLLQRTKNPQNAIVGLDVVLGDEIVGPDLPDHHFAVAVPIRQHPGAYEKSRLIPYIVFKRTANSLIDEEDCLSIVTDVKILMGQDRHLQAPLGYTKIPFDLRQTPEDLERAPNLDYVFICYKTDKQLSLVERDLLIFRRIGELERSYFTKADFEQFKQLSEQDRFLSTSYNLDFLTELARTLKESLLGPLGDYYLEKRRDILNDICCRVYQTYLQPVLQKIDQYVEMRNQKEYFGEFVDALDNHVIKVKCQFVEAFNVIHRVLTRESFVSNIIMYMKFSIYYANLLEETGDFRNAVQSLRATVGKLVEYREERMKACLDSGASVTTPMSITVDNKKISDMQQKMRSITDRWKELVLRKERDRERKEAEEGAIDEDEGDEEQAEVLACLEELKDKDLFEREIDREAWHAEDVKRNDLRSKKYFSEQDQIIHALHVDLLMNLYRCEVKLGKEMNVVKNQTNKMLTKQGIDLAKHAPGNLTKNLATSLGTKMNMKQTSKTLAGSKTALKELQHTLQEAGKLPPAKPQVLPYEKILVSENNRNPYQNALLYMSLAVAKTNAVSQKSLLLQSLEYIKKAKSSEEALMSVTLENSVQVSASRFFHPYFMKSPDQMHPLSLLANPLYIKKSPVPVTPIMIARTSTSITMKLPFYKPITEYKAWRKIDSTALYGKPSGSGVAVSLNNTDYEGTGEKKAPGQIAHVTGLIPNETYVFAAAGFTEDAICVNGIGETCKEILTLLPLPLMLIQGYLAEIAFKLGHYQISKLAAESVCSSFVVKNEYKYSYLDARVNPVLAVRLNTAYFNLISPIEAKQLSESFIILARVSRVLKNDVQKRALSHELKVESQKMDLRIANYLVIALDIGTMLNRPILIKRTVCELYNHLLAYLQMQSQSPLLLHILVKCHQAIRLIPSDQIDATSRKILSCISFQIMRLGFQTNEEQMLRRVMLSELPINSRKWRKYATYIIKQHTLTEDEQKLFDEQKQKIAAGEDIPVDQLIQEPGPIEEKHLKIKEFEVEGASFEEFLLQLGDYADIVKQRTERWQRQLTAYTKQITDGEIVAEEEKDRIQALVDFWEGVRHSNPVVQLQQLCSSADAESKRYLEFCCKCVRRAMEQPETDLEEVSRILNESVRVNPEDMIAVLDILESRVKNLESDIVVKQRQRFEVLEEKVKTLLEQRTLSGGNNQITTKQLQRLMQDTESGMKGKNAANTQSQQQVTFKNEEEKQASIYRYLWVSEKFYLTGITQFVNLAKTNKQRGLHELDQPMNCVFNDIIRLDFTKFKQVLAEYQVVIKEREFEQKRFEEEHKRLVDEAGAAGNPPPEPAQREETEDVKRINKMAAFLQQMARAAQFALNSNSWLQLVSIIVYVWNAFAYDLTNPLELCLVPSAWQSVVIIAECSLYLLEFLQRGGKLRVLAGQDIDKVKHQKPRFDKDGRTVGFKFDIESDAEDAKEEGEGATTSPADRDATASKDAPEKSILANKGATTGAPAQQEESKDASASSKSIKWFDQLDEFDMTTQASFISFTLQCLMTVSKWESMVDISNRVNSATENQFASQLLPFIIYAQTTLFQQAANNTADKKRELEVRIQAFENWKLTSKKKRSRTASITGEIPPEEREFLKDKAVIEKEVFRLEVIESVLNSDKEASNKLLENIKRDANNAEESLKACRKLYFQFGVETENLRAEEQSKGCYGVEQINNSEIRSKRKSHRVFTNMVINSYKKCIQLLRKRQEKYMLIQALHELGNLHYADDNLGEAEVQWNDCVDTIFQRLYVVREFRQVFKDNSSLGDSFGSKQVLVGGIVLTKLAKLCYEGKDLHKYTECVLMASELFAAPAKLTLPHPQTSIEYANYSFREFLDGRVAGEEGVFQDKQVLQPSELLHCVQTNAQALIDLDVFPQVLPLCALMEYVSQRVVKSAILVTKARVLKAHALIEIGYIHEAILVYKRIIEGKDLPKHGSRYSIASSRTEGPNFQFNRKDGYRNDLSPEADENAPALVFIQQALEGNQLNRLKAYCSPNLVEEIKALRCIFMLRLGENENVENLDKASVRAQLLQGAETGLRSSLRVLASNFEVSHFQEQIRLEKLKKINIDESFIDGLNQKLQQAFERAEVSEADMQGLFTNTEEQQSFADRQSQTLSQMMRYRLLIGRLYRKQGMMINSFYVLREALNNFKKYAEGLVISIEKGEESDQKGHFKLPEMYGGILASAPSSAGAGAKGKAAPPAKPPASKGKGLKEEDKTEDQSAQEEILRKQREQEEAERARIEAKAQLKRTHPHIMLWLKTKIEIISILLNQSRIEDVTDSISVTKLECMAIRDQLFIRKLDEIDFMVMVKSGQLSEAMHKASEINIHAKKYFQADIGYAEFLGSLSELLYNLGKAEEACEAVKEGRKISWYRLRDQGIEIDSQNINKSGDVLVQNDRKKFSEEQLQNNSSVPPTAQGKDKKAPPAKDAKAKGAAVAEEQAPEEEDEQTPLDFTQPVSYDLIPATEQANSSCNSLNIYLESLPMAIRFDIRYSQYCVILQSKYELAVKLLKDTLKLIDRTLFVSPQLKFYCQFLLGLSNQKIFEEQVLSFQSQYSKQRKYKASLADHIPFNGIALGEYLIELPNFSKQLKDKLISLLTLSQGYYEEAINVGKDECILYEGGFNLKDACQGLSQIAFYLGEYRQRVLEYKYAKYLELDRERKQKRREEQKNAEDDDENKEAAAAASQDGEAEQIDQWEENKQSKEKLEVFNNKKASAHYLKATIAIGEAQRVFLDEAHKLGAQALADAAKIPREVASELFEASQVNKVLYEKLAGFEFKDKQAISSSEIIAYLKAVLLENGLFTFGQDRDRLGKLISKLHRYLLANLPAYQAQCSSTVRLYTPVEEVSAANPSDLVSKAECLSTWIDVQGENSQMFYILGPLDQEEIGKINSIDSNAAESQPAQTLSAPVLSEEQKAAFLIESKVTYYGSMEADSVQLSALHQEVRDLVNKMQASEKLSEAQNERDRRGYQTQFEQLIDKLGGFYKPPILSEEEADKDVDCLKLVKEFIPPLTTDNVLKLSKILRMEQGNSLTDVHYNAILRSFHKVRYAK